MFTETLSALTKPTEGVLEPVQKLNQQAVAAVQKLAAHQLRSLKTYSELGVGQLKAAAEVRDVEGLQTLMSKQTDVVRELGERIWADTKELAQMGVDFATEAKKIGSQAAPAAAAKAKAA